MKNYNGIYKATKKDGTFYFRASLTYKGKHISLGSFPDARLANLAYEEGKNILQDCSLSPDNIHPMVLSYEKSIILMNFRDNGLYFKTPVYMHASYISYHYNQEIIYTFDMDDLFYFGNHKIMKRGGHLFVADYGMQVNVLNRYGIKNFAVKGRDYEFANGIETDFRYSNIRIINHYHGVRREGFPGACTYAVYLHVNGDFLVGRYTSETEAAIAYNKAVDLAKKQGICKDYPVNYIDGLPPSQYAAIYDQCAISAKLSK